MASTIAHVQILDSVYVYTYRDESVVEVLRGLCGTGILIAFIDPTDGPWSDDLMASDNKWRPMIDAVLYTVTYVLSQKAEKRATEIAQIEQKMSLHVQTTEEERLISGKDQQQRMRREVADKLPQSQGEGVQQQRKSTFNPPLNTQSDDVTVSNSEVILCTIHLE